MKKEINLTRPTPTQNGDDDFLVDTFFIKADKSALLRQNKLQAIGRFLLENEQLFNHLGKHSLLGFPADAVFGSRQLSQNISQQLSILFVLTCGISDAEIAMDIDKTKAFQNYKQYCQDYTTANHVWVEFTLNGNRYAADFNQQLVYFAQDYYKANQHNANNIVRVEKQDIELADVVDAYIALAKAINKKSYSAQTLMQSYENLIANLSCDPANSYLVNRLAGQSVLLKSAGMPHDYFSDAYLLCMAAGKIFKTASLNNLADGSITPNQIIDKIRMALHDRHGEQVAEVDKNANKVLDKLFPLTNKLDNQINELAITGHLASQ